MKRLFAFLLAMVMLCTMLPQLSFDANATASPITTNTELVERAINVANNYKTLYVMGGWGQPLSAYNKQRLIDAWDYNQGSTRKAMINAASSDTFAFDCVCFIKGLLWGWDGTLSATNGGAVYGSNGVADVDANGMINICKEVSSDFSNIEIGEIVWTNGHVGLYIGDGKVVECTPSWKNCVQITGITGYQNWKKHGKLPYVEYNTEPALDKATYPAYCAIKVTSNTTYVKSLPCSQDSDPNSTNVESGPAQKGAQYQAIGLVENKYGNLWYKVKANNGKTGYMYAGDTEFVERKTDDITAPGVTVPANHQQGKTYILSGSVKADYNYITEVSAHVHKGNSTKGEIVTGASATVDGHSYSLGGSSIDNKTEFNKLPVGTYTYAVSVTYMSCFATSGTRYGGYSDTIPVYTATFNVTSGGSSSGSTPGKPVLNVNTDCTDSNPTIFTWASTANTTHYNLWIETSIGKGWEAYEWISYAESGVSRTLPPGNYRFELQAYNSNAWNSDRTDWLYTAADYEYLTISCGNHSYSSSVTQAATCGTNGIRTYTCSKCGNSYTETIPATGKHNYKSTVLQSATCGDAGTMLYTCSVCRAQYKESIPATGHNFKAVVTAPTCKKIGYTTYTCICGENYIGNYTSALGHSFTDYKSNNDATYDADGTKTAKCDRCNATDTVVDEGSKLQPKNGWIAEDGKWYYYANDVMKTGWLQLGSTWYYMNAEGAMQTGWQQIGGTWYYFNASGAMVTGWLQSGSTWYYFNASGAMVTGWQQIGGTWYYFKSGGAMVTGWLQLGSTWYYFNASGAMVTGTVTINGKQNKFDASGAWLGEVSQNGWVQEGGKWYYYQNSAKVTGWKQVSGKWYYFNASGVMQTGWLQVGGTWYYFQSGGAMQTGWLQQGNTWYYLKSSGAMATGSVTIGGKVYYFNSSGACLNP